MKFGGMTALLTAALVLTGCDNTPVDLHGLPAGAAERATLCSRAALAHSFAAKEAGEAEKKRRQDLLQQMIRETAFFAATGLDEEKGKAFLGEIEKTLRGGNWLGTLNQCKAAYLLGDAEPLPVLPADPKDRPAACAAVAVASALDDDSSDPDVLQRKVLTTPSSSYFMIAAANHDGGMAAAQNAMAGKVVWAIASGAVGPLTDACIREYPKAAADATVTLPTDAQQAVTACSFNAGLFMGLEGPDGATAKAVLRSLQRQEAMPDAAMMNSPQKLLEQALGLGPPTHVLKACAARFK